MERITRLIDFNIQIDRHDHDQEAISHFALVSCSSFLLPPVRPNPVPSNLTDKYHEETRFATQAADPDSVPVQWTSAGFTPAPRSLLRQRSLAIQTAQACLPPAADPKSHKQSWWRSEDSDVKLRDPNVSPSVKGPAFAILVADEGVAVEEVLAVEWIGLGWTRFCLLSSVLWVLVF